MQHSFSRAATAGLFFAIFVAASASASIITDSFTATVSSGIDTANLFGGGNLTGKAVSATLSFNTSQLNYAVSAGSEDYVGGGSGFNLSLSIGGVTVSQNVSFGEIVAQSAGADTQWTIAAFNDPGITFEVYTLGSWAAGDINQPFSIDFTRADNAVFAGNERIGISAPTGGGGGGPSPAPEPSSAFLLGSGLAAFGAWRRRKAV